jgi:putative flippase GtrA
MRIASSEFGRFCVVGAIGFCIDTTVLLILVKAYGASPYLGRVFSYLVAATGTWSLNRHITFASSRADEWHHEWGRYLIVNAIGGSVNYASYSICVWSLPIVRQYLILGVAVGAACGLVFNYTASRYLVFRAEG